MSELKSMRFLFIVIIMIIALVLWSCQTNNNGKKTNEVVNLYKTYCVNCHGIDGSLMTNGARDLRYSKLNLDERILVITHGRNIMTSFKHTLTPAQILAVAQHTFQFSDSIHAE